MVALRILGPLRFFGVAVFGVGIGGQGRLG